jgi:hypothetical protein
LALRRRDALFSPEPVAMVAVDANFFLEMDNALYRPELWIRMAEIEAIKSIAEIGDTSKCAVLPASSDPEPVAN